MSLAARLKEARASSGLSQRALAEQAGLSNAYVNLVEHSDDEAKTGRIGNPTLDSLGKLAAVLGVRVEWLAFGTGEMREEERPADSQRVPSTDTKAAS